MQLKEKERENLELYKVMFVIYKSIRFNALAWTHAKLFFFVIRIEKKEEAFCLYANLQCLLFVSFLQTIFVSNLTCHKIINRMSSSFRKNAPQSFGENTFVRW